MPSFLWWSRRLTHDFNILRVRGAKMVLLYVFVPYLFLSFLMNQLIEYPKKNVEGPFSVIKLVHIYQH